MWLGEAALASLPPRCRSSPSHTTPRPTRHHRAHPQPTGAGREEDPAQPGAGRGGRALPPGHLRRDALPPGHARHAAQPPRGQQPDPAQRPPLPPGTSATARRLSTAHEKRTWHTRIACPSLSPLPDAHAQTPPTHAGVHLQRGAGEEDCHRPPLRRGLPRRRAQDRRPRRVRQGRRRRRRLHGHGRRRAPRGGRPPPAGGSPARHHERRAHGVPGPCGGVLCGA